MPTDRRIGSRGASRPVAARRSSLAVLLALEIDWLDIAFIVQMLLIALINSFTYLLIGSRPLFLYPALAINLGFTAICALRNRYAFLYTLAFLAFMLTAVLVFVLKYGVPLNLAQLGSYAAPMSIPLFGVYATRHGLSRALFFLYVASAIYLLFFLYMHHHIDADAILAARRAERGALGGFLMTHDAASGAGEVAFRIYVADMNMAIGLFYSFARYRTSRQLRWLVSTGLFFFVFVIADFRFALATATVVSIASLLPLSLAAKARAAMVLTTIAMLAALLFGLNGANMYSLVANDTTGMVRDYEGQLSTQAFVDNPWFGTGLPGNGDDMHLLFGNILVAPSDIGYLGMLFRFGVVGFAMLYVANLLMARFTLGVCARQDLPLADRRTVVDLWLYVAITQLLSTFVLDGGGGVLLALSMGYMAIYGATTVRRRRTRPGVALGRIG